MTPDNDYLLAVGQRIRERRQALELSVRQLARQADVSPSYVSAIETGKNPSTGRPTVPSKRVLASLCRALGMSLDGQSDAAEVRGAAAHDHDHTLVYVLGEPRTSVMSLLSGIYGTDVDHWVHIADPRTVGVTDQSIGPDAPRVTRIVWPFGSDVYPNEFLVPERIDVALARELAQMQGQHLGNRVGLMIEDCSVVMRWMVNPETEVANEAVWPEKACHAFSSCLGMLPAANVCVYKHSDLEAIANRIDILSTLLSLIESHESLICVDVDGSIEMGESAAVRILTHLRPSGVTLDAWNTLARASAQSLARKHHLHGVGAGHGA